VDYGCETSVENKGGSNPLGRLKQARVRAFHAEQLAEMTGPEAYERYDQEPATSHEVSQSTTQLRPETATLLPWSRSSH
jgi:hypothetical protein